MTRCFWRVEADVRGKDTSHIYDRKPRPKLRSVNVGSVYWRQPEATSIAYSGCPEATGQTELQGKRAEPLSTIEAIKE